MKEEIKSGIYCIKNVITNKKYIGQSNNIKDRWRKKTCSGYHWKFL